MRQVIFTKPYSQGLEKSYESKKQVHQIMKGLLLCMKICGIYPCILSKIAETKNRWKRLSIQNWLVILVSTFHNLYIFYKLFNAFVLENNRSKTFLFNFLEATMNLSGLVTILAFLLNQDEISTILFELEQYIDRTKMVLNVKYIKRKITKYIAWSVVTGIAIIAANVHSGILIPEANFQNTGQSKLSLMLGNLAINTCFVFCYVIAGALIKVFFLGHCMIFQACVPNLYQPKNCINVITSDLVDGIHRQKDLVLIVKRLNRYFSKPLFIWFAVYVISLVFGIPVIIQNYERSKQINLLPILTEFYNIYSLIALVLIASNVEKPIALLREPIMKIIQCDKNCEKEEYLEKVETVEKLSNVNLHFRVCGYFTITKSLLLAVLIHAVTFTVIILQMSPKDPATALSSFKIPNNTRTTQTPPITVA